MRQWNVVVTLKGRGFARPLRLLRRFGEVQRTGFFNVLVLCVPDVAAFLEQLRLELASGGELAAHVAHVYPVHRTFTFHDVAEFQQRSQELALSWVPELATHSFHVRLHRRGSKGRLASAEEERRLDGVLLQALAARGTPGRISFDDPDAVLDVEVVGPQAGSALWRREELGRYPFLGID